MNATQERIDLVSDESEVEEVPQKKTCLTRAARAPTAVTNEIISLDDTLEEDLVIITENKDSSNKSVNKEEESASPSIEIEDGEVTIDDNDEDDEKKNLVFTVSFKCKNDFISFNERLQKALSCEFENDGIKLSTTCADDTDIPMLFAYRTATEEPINIDSLFRIDTEPAIKFDTEKVPSYKRAVKRELDGTHVVQKNDEDKCMRPKATSCCFNCGSAQHSLRECPNKLDNARIQRAKKQHSAKNERYHIDIEQRFAHIKPGTLSNETRAALGLQRGELPFMFYRMRVLGYPPAWLEHAQVISSGMALFNADGSAVPMSDEDNGTSQDGIKYDILKIAEFPGYNVHPGSRFYDDYRHHNVPPINDSHMKERMIEALGDNIFKRYKRKKLNFPNPHDTDDTPSDKVILSADEMEIEDDSELTNNSIQFSRPPPPTEDPPESDNESPPLPPAEDPPESDNESPPLPPASPTMEDLKAKQEQLLQQLDANTTADSEISLLEKTTEDNEISIAETTQLNESVQTEANESIATSQSSFSEACFKNTHIGTPILKFSEYEHLPSGNNFKVGVSDVINFENLPNSTGKYQSLNKKLKEVRKKMKKSY